MVPVAVWGWIGRQWPSCRAHVFMPALCVSLLQALAMADKTIADVDAWEINEAFAVVTLANTKVAPPPPEPSPAES